MFHFIYFTVTNKQNNHIFILQLRYIKEKEKNARTIEMFVMFPLKNLCLINYEK